MRDPKKERERLLRILEKEHAELEWPCQNKVLLKMVEGGEVKIARRYSSYWGGREHNMVTLHLGTGSESASGLGQCKNPSALEK